jgi:prepilin-type N-terminal cleavage/methylation domain-containing protein
MRTPHRSASPSGVGRAFTLIELLVVIAIIAVLAALAVGSYGSIMDRITISKVQNQHMRGLTAAMSMYKADNMNRWPATKATNGEFNSWYGPPTKLNDGKKVMVNLRPYYGDGGIKEDGTFKDPWGNQYSMKWDIDNSGKLEYYDKANRENIPSTFIVVSLGKNRTQDNPRLKTADDVFSFCQFKDTNYFK